MTQETITQAKESFRKGLQALKDRNFAEASAYFETAVDLRPENIEHHYHLAYAYLLRGQFPLSMRVINRAVKLDPSKVKTYTLQNPYASFFVLAGLIHQGQKNMDKAIRSYEKAILMGSEKKEQLQQRIEQLKKKISQKK